MTKTEECNRCHRFSGHYSPKFPVCSIHLSGPTETPCPDFDEATEQLEPLGADYDGQLMLQPIEILDTHPFFTSICPTCGAGLAEDGQMHCDRCGWREELIS